uniref:Secreted protein n=1 Tax=Globodera pallida TaxID=36090 RepID=A0A183CH74_GLOPA
MHWKLIYLIAVHRAFAAPDPEAEAFPAGDEKSKEKEIGDHSLQQIKRVLNLTLKPIFGSKSVENFVGRGEMEEANFDKMCDVVTALGFEKLANKLFLMNNLKADEEEEEEASEANMGAEKYSSEMFALFLFSRICEEMLELTENNVLCNKQKDDEIRILFRAKMPKCAGKFPQKFH